MPKKPSYQIRRFTSPQQKFDDGKDITAMLAPYLSRVQVHDRAGGKSDAITIEFADDGTVPLPPRGQRLGLQLGYDGEHAAMRTQMTVDQYASSGPPAAIRMSATGADFTSEMRAKKERTFDKGQTLLSVLKALAEPHGERAQIKPDSLAQLELPMIDQAGKSDLGLAMQLADIYGGIFKPGNGVWGIVGYDAMPASNLTIDLSEVGQWNAHFIARRAYPTVIAHYHDLASAQRVPVAAGSGDKPVTLIDQTFATEQIASAHANAKRNKGIRESRQLQLVMAGRPDLQTLSRVTLSGFRQELNTDWLITEVTHTIDKNGGYQCQVSAEGVADQ